ncbi:AGAP008370-PA-like protein [Anopheles sinensis]|uniref:Zinc carboxypeptidase A 1 n=1 Tax=Anopheles sinensis TaxID=74873 RepID=A0A084W5X4_ANOSI|nr:AGAP008370-PA-like protein [Anopheles sinensis]
MVFKSAFLLLCLAAGMLQGEQVRYDNYRVYEVAIANRQQLEAFQHLERYPDGYLFWESPVQTNMKVNIVVPPHKFAEFEELSGHLEVASRLRVPNLQQLIDEESPKKSRRAFGWEEYQTLEDIYTWIDEQVAQYPNILSVETIGRSYENREVKAVKMSYKSGNPGVFIEANIHAREWITSATVTWLINEFLTSTDPSVRDLAENYDWYILPVVNPDGFHYSKETNRLWRKNRYPHSVLCYGVDMNRNFPGHWMGGASPVACNDIFAGPEPASEIETKNTIAYYETIVDRIELHLQFHSYGQYILLPYGYQGADYPDNYSDQMEIAKAAADGFATRYNTRYTYGTIADVLYVDSGSTTDWSHGYHKTPLSMCFEFRDNGPYGFVLPPDQIIPNAEETLDAMIAMLAKAKTMGYFNRT